MEYKGFQRTMALFGSLLILISTLLVFMSTRQLTETVGQILFFVILLGALWYGRRGGLLTAVFATTVYTALQFNSFLTYEFFENPVLPLIAVRAIIYIVAGALGGEIFFRIKHFMIEVSQEEFVDKDTKLFNGYYFSTLVDMETKKFERYNTVSSIVTFEIDPETLNAYLTEPKSPGIKYLADGFIGNVRLVDEVGRVEGNIFAVILPFTPKAGAEIVAKRLQSIAINRVGYKESVTYNILSLPDDKEHLDNMVAKLSAGQPDKKPVEA